MPTMIEVKRAINRDFRNQGHLSEKTEKLVSKSKLVWTKYIETVEKRGIKPLFFSLKSERTGKGFIIMR